MTQVANANTQDSTVRKEELDKFNQDVKFYNYALKNLDRWHDAVPNMFKNFDALAAKGYAPAQYIMGVADKRGDFEGYPRNETAFKWLENSAKQGFYPALSYFGLFYEEENLYIGQKSIKQDYQKAAELYYEVAQKGDLHGQFRLGLLYTKGFGVPKSSIYAHAWTSVAIANGSKGGKGELETLEPELENLEKDAGFNLARAEEKAADIWESIDRNFVKELDEKFGIESRHVMR